MERQQAIDEIKGSWKRLYPADRKKKGIVCPLCGSGSGPNGTGITGNKTHNKPNSLKCWSCDFSGDVIDLIQEDRGLDFNEAIQYAADELGIIIDPYNSIEQAKRDFDEEHKAPPKKEPEKGIEEPLADYNEYYKSCKKNISNPAAASYLQARGISLETAAAFSIGFDANWISPTLIRRQKEKGESWLPAPTARIILPISKSHYIARAVFANEKKEFQKMNETGGGSVDIFNSKELYQNNDAVFITEGVFDALSIVEAGGKAIALNSTSNAEKMLKQLEETPTAATLILCLDNDAAGEGAKKTLEEGLRRLNISYVVADITGGSKDPNEALTTDRAQFIKAVCDAKAKTAAKPDNTQSYIDNMMQGEIEKLKAASDRKTGFANLDELSGGLYPGLYVIAATSSLGKTTFSLQIADNLAGAGIDVLFFSLEQSRLELVSKSLSRICKEAGDDASSLSIRKGYCAEAAAQAAAAYKERIADRLSIIEGNFNCDISFIGDYVSRYIAKNNCRPIVFIDYLQILQPSEDTKKATTKETVDNTVIELKRLSREQELTIFIISSVNRANYLTPIDFESLKESGGIEYTSDVIWGLQLQCLNEPLFSETNKIKEKRQRIRQEKAATPRKIELLCLKNRYGISNYSCGFDYYPAADLFIQENPEEFAPYYGANPFGDTTPKIDYVRH